MPGFTTHYFFGVDAYQRILNLHIRQNLHRNHGAFALGLQGPDVFFYYLPSHLFHRVNLGAMAHDHDTGAFFSYLLESRQLFGQHSHQLAVADAYLSGFLGHYTLDCTVHPYVYAHTNYTPAVPPKQTQYFGQHAYLETELDNQLLYMKKQLLPAEFHQNHTIRLNPLQQRVISKMLVYAYQNTYPSLTVSEHMMRSAFHWMKTGTKVTNDPSGQKKVLVRAIEQRILGRAFLSPMVPSSKHRFVTDPMNLQHRAWVHPWTRELFDTSFLDLYHQAGQLYDHRLRQFYRMLREGFTEEGRARFCRQEYGNRSFLSGLPLR